MITTICLIIFNFILYSFFGWIIEHLYSKYSYGHFKNDYFLIGPWKPMYGIAFTLIIIFSYAFKKNFLIMIPLCFFIPTMVEYISGYMLKRLFNKLYWNYSTMKLNVNGFICFTFSMYWTLLCVFGIYFIQPVIDIVFFSSYNLWITITPTLSFLFVTDLVFTIKNMNNAML